MQSDQPVNILMVDDRPENLVALESVLSDLGQNLVKASSGTEALRRLLEDDFAVILLDVQMPGMDGFETARLIRERERSQHTPIVFLTAINKSESHVARGYEVGAVDYVFKPFVPEVLRAKVTAFVDLAKKTKELQLEIEQRRAAETKLDRSNALLEAISGALVGYIAGADPSHAFQQLLANVQSLTGSEYGFVVETAQQRGRRTVLIQHAELGLEEGEERGGEPAGAPRCDFNAIFRKLAGSRAPLVVNEARKVPGARRAPAGGELQNLLALPLMRGEQLVGMIGFGNHPDGFHPELVERLEPLQSTCATIIEAHRNDRRRLEAEGQVRKLNDDLERRVAERTAELARANRELQSEIAERRRIEDERARVLEREQAARAEAEAAQQRLAFLGEASAILAGSLDYRTTMERVARLVVPSLGDFCIIDIAADDGEIRRVAAVHADPARDGLMQQLEHYSPTLEGSQPASRVLLSGQSELIEEVDEEWLAHSSRDAEHLRLMTELAPCSYMVVPLIARGNPVGVISIGTAESRRKYGHLELRLAEDLARRAAAALDNARLFSELEDSARRKDEFLAMLAHELRNPLAAISNADYVLDEVSSGNDRVSRLREIISRQTKHLARLVDDLLDISRITRGKIELRKEPLDLVAVVQRAVETTGPLIDGRQHELHVELPESPICLEADPTRLEQILANLLNNAAKYTEPGGTIWLAVRTIPEGDQEWAEVRVRDTGIGMHPELLPRIFELFTQSERSLDRSEGGLGIGLALVRNLIQLHGGTIHATSQGPGTGSEFVVRLPVIVSNPQSGEDCAPRVTIAGGEGGRRVLLVEDNTDAAETLVEMLELWGHEVEVAHNGVTGIEMAARYRPQVVLLDIGLPGMDGYEVARRLRQLHQNGGKKKTSAKNGEMLLVALTGYGQAEDRHRSAEAGFDLHLTKPVDPAELQRLLGTGSLS
ncbi:MAG: response regulator [Armatimonadota bacterium]